MEFEDVFGSNYFLEDLNVFATVVDYLNEINESGVSLKRH